MMKLSFCKGNSHPLLFMIFKREYPVLQVGDESAHTPTSLNFLLVLDILRNRGLRYMSDTLHIVRSRPEGRESAL